MNKFKLLSKQLWRSNFARSVTVVASGTAVAQAITLAFTPIITRLYGPEAFGVLGSFNALLAILLPLAALSYPIAIVLPKADEEARALVRLSLKLGLCSSLLVALLILLYGDVLANLLNMNLNTELLWFVPVSMFLSVCLATTTQWVVRKKYFKLKAKAAVVSALFQNTLKSGIGLFWTSETVLIAVVTIGKAFNTWLFWLGIRKGTGSSKNRRNPEAGRAYEKELAKKYVDFALFRTPQIVLNTATQSVPILMLAALYNPAIAGYYALAKMVLAAPTKIIGTSVGTVFYPHFNETIQTGKSGSGLLLRATASLALIGCWPFIIVFVIGPFLFEFIFGEEWRAAGDYARWLSLWIFTSFLCRPVVASIPVLNMQGTFLVFEIVSAILRLGSIYLAFTFFSDPLTVVFVYSLVNVVTYITLWSITYLTALRRVSDHN